MPSALVLFDEDCALCRQLAAQAGRRTAPGTAFRGWQSFTSSVESRERLPEASRGLPASELRVLCDDGGLLEGVDAWAYLVAQHPDLRGLDWLARRLGLVREAAAALRGAGALLRALCPRCPRRTPPWRERS
jgi:hypothetical protein